MSGRFSRAAAGRFQAETGIEQPVLWGLAIFVKGILPLSRIKRGNGPCGDIPFRDGQAGARQAGDSAEDYLYQHHTDADIDPDGYRAGRRG